MKIRSLDPDAENSTDNTTAIFSLASEEMLLAKQ